MSLFVLDTDSLSLLQAGNVEISTRVGQRKPGEIAISVITVDEQLRGWYTLVRRAKKPSQIAAAYERLAKSVSFLSKTAILPFPESAVAQFETLKKAKL